MVSINKLLKLWIGRLLEKDRKLTINLKIRICLKISWGIIIEVRRILQFSYVFFPFIFVFR